MHLGAFGGSRAEAGRDCQYWVGVVQGGLGPTRKGRLQKFELNILGA